MSACRSISTAGLVAVAATMACTACSPNPWPARSRLTPDQEQRLLQIAEREMQLRRASERSFSGETWALGSIPYNARVLPLVSPDGRFIATSVGPAPTAATMYASTGAPPVPETTVEIWEMIVSYGGVRLQHTLPPPLLLGSSADAEGFIVESPRPDGARWIGKVDWVTGTLTWLVQDDRVNAFASLGRDGRLAWSTRKIDSSVFSLALRFPDGSEYGIGDETTDWLLPEWSMHSDRLSAYTLSAAGRMKIVSLDASTLDTIDQGGTELNIMLGASKWDACKATEYRHGVRGSQPSHFDEVVFYHPVQQRVVVWLPSGINAARPIPLAPNSIAAVHDDRGDFLLTTPDGLHWQDANELGQVVRVDHAIVFVRPTSNPMRPFILMDPGERAVHLRAMRPHHGEPAAPTADSTANQADVQDSGADAG